jgi:hypothetical protein
MSTFRRKTTEDMEFYVKNFSAYLWQKSAGSDKGENG